MAPSRGLLLSRRVGSSASRFSKHPLQSCTRHGHATPNFRSFSLDSTVESTSHFLHAVHSTGIPWYATIPLAALSVRAFITLPLTLLAAENREQRNQLAPLVEQARPELEREVIAKYNHLGPRVCTYYLSRAIRQKQKEVARRDGISRWPAVLPIIQFPVWLLLVETIRRMSGIQIGLLGLLSSTDAQTTSDTLPDIPAASEPAPELHDLDGVHPVTTPVIHGPLFEPSLAAEGWLWFPDLLAPDPQLLLPIFLSASMISNIVLEEKAADATGLTRPRPLRILMNILKIYGLAVAPLTMSLPAAVQWYWVSSSLLVFPQKAIANWKYPGSKSVVAAPDKPIVRSPIAQIPAPKKKYVPMKNARKRK